MISKEWKYLFLIIVTFIAACIETDIYLPAFTDMMAYFSISEEQIQSILTLNFVGICISGPFYGPISDSIGRKKPLMVALGLFLLGSIITLFAEDFNFMLFGRVLQGLGSGGCFTLGTAILFDAFQEKKAIDAINRINTIIPFIMAAAPMLGGYLNVKYGFRSNFLAIAFFVFLSFIISWFFFEETLPKEKRMPLQPTKVVRDFKTVLQSIPFWQTTLIVSLPFAGYLAFLSGASVLFVIEFGVNKAILPYYQASLLGAWLLANQIFRRIVEISGTSNVKMAGTALIALGGLALLITGWLTPQDPVLLTGAMMIFTFGVNWTLGLYFPEGMAMFPDLKGITSSILTSARLLITAAVVGLASYFYNSTIYPIIAVNCGVIAIILTTIYFYEKKKPFATSMSLPKT